MTLPRLTPNQIEQIAHIMGDTDGGFKDLLEKVKVLLGKFWQQGAEVFEDCRVSAKS